MAKMFTCPECGAQIMGDRVSKLVEDVQNHAEHEHDMELEEDEIRAGIEDT